MSMSPLSNNNFQRLLTELEAMGPAATLLASQDPTYQRFIQSFPAGSLQTLSLDDYCVGKGNRDTFCWWLERGLEPVLGRYMPGTSRGHIVYFLPDGTVYKNRKLLALDDQQALAYTLSIQAAIANIQPAEDWRWVDDDDELYRRAGVDPLVTIGEGRKLRLLSAYHPDDALPTSSSGHLGHFLLQLGCPAASLPSAQHPVARMLLLREYWLLAQQRVPGVTTLGFMRALYTPGLGLVPVKEVGTETELTISLTGGAIRNAYIRIPKGQVLFSEDYFAADENDDAVQFKLDLPDGTSIQTCLLTNRGRVKARFNSLFNRLNVAEGDKVTLSRVDEGHFEMLLEQRDFHSAMDIDLQIEDQDEKDIAVKNPLNQILYGPPGTGKTYETIYAALQILDLAAAEAYKQVDDDEAASPAQRLAAREKLKQRFDELSAEQRVRFVTFHQSFSYEDFVEGLRAETDETTGQIRYEVVDGVFKSLCESASVKVTQQAPAPVDLAGRRIWKMSLGNTQSSDAGIFDECLQGGYVLLGYGNSIDFSGCKSRDDVLQRYASAGQTIAENTDYNLTSVTTFVTRMQIGDLVVVSDGNFKFRAIGEITGDYAYKPHPDYDDSYAQLRPVRWLRQYTPSLPRTELLNSQFSQMTLYELRSPALDKKKLEALLGVSSSIRTASQFYVGQIFGRDYRVVRVTDDLLEISKPNGNLLPLSMNFLRELAEAVQAGKITIEDIRQKSAMNKLANSQLEPFLVNGYPNILAPLVEQLCQAGNVTQALRDQVNARVLIIDEINRGNISRIFGELITLIEPSKRAGADEALSVTLPYSKKPFYVPDNVYLIGTMNTADRSLAGLDLALRRRFSFTEMPPRPELLDVVEVDGIHIGQMLRVMNQRITVLLDRDHTLGHAYFMPLQTAPTLARLAAIFRQAIMPLLQEYFFEDWERIRWVLNDQNKPASDAFIVEDKSLDLSGLFKGVQDRLRQAPQWTLNDKAFANPDAYRRIAANPGKPVQGPSTHSQVIGDEAELEA